MRKIRPDLMTAVIAPTDPRDLAPPPAPASLLRNRGPLALFLDLDGVLAPIESRPEDVGPDPRRSRLLDALTGALEGRLAVLSGRALADVARYRRKRAGHLQSKGRFLAAQLHAMLERDVWLDNARHANAAAQEIGSACAARLMHPVEANEVFIRLSPDEREMLRGIGYQFYDWGADAARFVASWDSDPGEARALGQAIADL